VAGNTLSTVQSNQTFTTGVVPIVVGVLNPVNSPQSVWDCGVGMSYASMTTVVTGSPVSFTIVLEGTYDGNTWTTLATTTNVAGDTQYTTGLINFTNLRARCTAVSGGSSPTVNVFVTAGQAPTVPNSGGPVPIAQLASGYLTPITTVATTTNGVTGTTADFLAARRSMMFQVMVTGTPTGGTITFQASLDGANWVTLTNASVYAGTAGSIAAGVLNANATTNALISPNAGTGSGVAMRYFRANTTTLTGGSSPTVTVLASAY
jgi:hypothetical protein